MRIRVRPVPLRLVLALALPVSFCFGVVGCGSEGPKTGTSGELPPEAKAANKNMEDFMKTKKSP